MINKNKDIPRDKRGRILPRMTRANLAEMLNVNKDMSLTRLMAIAIKVVKHKPTLKHNLKMMCYLEEDAATGTLSRTMKYMLQNN